MSDALKKITLPGQDFLSLIRIAVRLEKQLDLLEVSASAREAEAPPPAEQPDLETFAKLLHCEKHEVLVRSKAVPWLRAQLERLFAGKDSVESIAADIEKHEENLARTQEEATAEVETWRQRDAATATRYTELCAALEIDCTSVFGSLHENALRRVKELKEQRTLYHEGVRKYDELLEALGYSALGSHENVIKYIKLARETKRETT